MSQTSQPPPEEQMVKTYNAGFGGTAEKKLNKDLMKMSKEGWRIQNQSATSHPWTGQVRAIVVVYVRP